MTVRLAFTVLGGSHWTGGTHYLVNLMKVMAEHAPGEVAPVMLVAPEASEAEVAPFAAVPSCEIVRAPALSPARKADSLLRSVVLGRDAAFSALLEQQRIDVLFEAAAFFGRRVGRPTIAWMPDFQHLFLPHLFSRVAWWKRELGSRVQVNSGRTVMVSSEDARRACLRFYPRSAGRVEVVRFAVPAPPALDDAAARHVANRYQLPAHYFFMPNQYWKHKNHELVVQALALLRGRGQPVTVMAPGRHFDARYPGHAERLNAHVAESGLTPFFRSPGLIPYEDLAPLMQASVALLNASLFEGWSTTVEEARSAGVPMLLSDLDVHREQAGEHASYFDRHSAASLADALHRFVPATADQRQSMREAARADARERLARFAGDFVQLVRHVAAAESREPA